MKSKNQSGNIDKHALIVKRCALLCPDRHEKLVSISRVCKFIISLFVR